MFAHDNPYQEAGQSLYFNVQLNYEKMRLMALREGYQKVWVVEDDTIPPTDALEKMLKVDAPVVTGVYVLRHGMPVSNLLKNDKAPTPGNAVGWTEIKWEGQLEVSGGCMGCLLIDVEALIDFSFLTGRPHPPDMDLMRYCVANGIKQVANLDVQCGHVKANGEILYPKDFIN